MGSAKQWLAKAWLCEYAHKDVKSNDSHYYSH